jgi:hypothetical protein
MTNQEGEAPTNQETIVSLVHFVTNGPSSYVGKKAISQ